MEQPILHTIQDFVGGVSRGAIPVNQSIRVSYPMGDRVDMIPFDDYCHKLSDTYKVPVLSLLRMIQRGVHGELLHRVNRSPIFKGKLQEVVDEYRKRKVKDDTTVVQEGQLVDFLSDRVSQPYDHTFFEKESQKGTILRSQLQAIEAVLDEVDEGTHRPLDDIIEGCERGTDHLHTQLRILQENQSEYPPPMEYVWKVLSLKPPSFYRSLLKNQRNTTHIKHTAKQVEKWIPDTIQTIFNNGLMIPVYLVINNEAQMDHVQTLLSSLEDIERSARDIKSGLPVHSSLITRLSEFFMSDPTKDEDDEEDEEEKEDIGQELLTAIHKLTHPDKEQQGEVKAPVKAGVIPEMKLEQAPVQEPEYIQEWGEDSPRGSQGGSPYYMALDDNPNNPNNPSFF
jgi:hypothetical protein